MINIRRIKHLSKSYRVIDVSTVFCRSRHHEGRITGLCNRHDNAELRKTAPWECLRIFKQALIILVALIPGLLTGCALYHEWLGDKPLIPVSELTVLDDPLTIKELWNDDLGHGTGGQQLSLQPALSFPLVYAADHTGYVAAYQAEKGKVIWERHLDLPISAALSVAGGRIVLGTENGRIIALDAEKGTSLWQTDLKSEILAIPQINDQIVITRSIDGQLSALAPAPGKVRWQYGLQVPNLTLRGSSTPTISRNVVIFGGDDGRLLILSLKNGAPLLDRLIAPGKGRTELERLADIDAQPQISQDGILYIAAYHNSITALNLNGGQILWQKKLSTHQDFMIDEKQLYAITDEDEVVAVNRLTGIEIWRQKALRGRHLSAPAGNLNYVVMGDLEGYLHWLDRDTGELRGRVSLGGAPIQTAPISSVDMLFAQDSDGNLAAYLVE